MDGAALSSLIGAETYSQLQSSKLPKVEMMTLLEFWSAESPDKLKKLAESGNLMPLLKDYRHSLEAAKGLRAQNLHLTVTGCLQVTELPLTL